MLERALAQLRAVVESLDPQERSWLAAVPVARLAAAFDAYPPEAEFWWVSPAVEAVVAEVAALAGERWLRRYLRLLVLNSVVRRLVDPPTYTLPPRLHGDAMADLERIIDDGRAFERYDVCDGAFQLDRALADGRVFPVGHVVAQASYRIPADVLPRLAAGVAEAPWVNIHLRWSEIRAMAYRRIDDTPALLADFLRANGDYVGLYGVAWVVDPAVGEVSPHLAYWRQLVLEGGAELFPLGRTPETIALATLRSPRRRQLYEEGRYLPTDYALVWQRDRFLPWAEQWSQ